MLAGMFRLLRIVSVLLLVSAVVTAAGFRWLASEREAYRPDVAAGPHAKFADVQGLRIHYRDWGLRNGPPLLLVHGAMAWSETWRDLAERLADSGFYVVAPDLPPFGFSDRPSARIYSRARHASLIEGFADAIGLKRFALAGHSFGGGATVEAAFDMKPRIERLVLLDVALGLGKEFSEPAFAGLLGPRWLRNLIVASTFTNPFMIGKGLRDFVENDAIVTEERIEIYRRPLIMADTTNAVGDWMVTGLYVDESKSRAADPDYYRAFDKPVLVIWGRNDTVTPLADGETIAAAFPNARLEVLDGVNHIPHVEDPAAVAALMADFLRGRKPPKPAAQKKPKAPEVGALRGTLTALN